MKTLFLCANRVWASARFRAEWPARYMDGAQVLTHDEFNAQPDQLAWDAYVFIKQGDDGLFKQLIEHKKQIWIDWCDPGWWHACEYVKQLCALATGITCSTQALADDMIETIGPVNVHVIPDRVEPSCYLIRREHDKVDPVKFIWFGAFQNRITLLGAHFIDRLAAHGYNVTLTICDDHPEQVWNFTEKVPIYHVKWQEEFENQIYAAHDIAILPVYPGPWGLLKSNNKHVTATACNLPVTDAMDWEHTKRLVEDHEYRQATASRQLGLYTEYLEPWKSAAEWERLLNEHRL